MDRSSGLLPFMDVLTGLMGVIILINIILSLSMTGDEGAKVRVFPKEEDILWNQKEANPLFVVCSENHIMLHKTRVPIAEVRMKSFFHGEVRTAADKYGPNVYLLALIKPDGYKSFRYVRAAAKQLGLKLGYEPIDGNWEIVY